MVTNFITPDGDDDMNISYVNSNKTTSLPVELDALNNKDISYAKDFFLYIETQLKIAKDFCRPGEEVSSSIASKVFHAFIDLVNKIRGKKDFMYICTLCCFAEEVKGDYSHYRTFLFDIGNQYKVKLTQSGKKELSLTLEFNDTIIAVSYTHLHHDFCGVAILTGLIGPFTGTQLTFDINLRTFIKSLHRSVSSRQSSSGCAPVSDKIFITD